MIRRIPRAVAPLQSSAAVNPIKMKVFTVEDVFRIRSVFIRSRRHLTGSDESPDIVKKETSSDVIDESDLSVIDST